MDTRSLLASFMPHINRTSNSEKIRSGLAGGIAIMLLTLILNRLSHSTVLPLLILTSMASSAALLYATPHSPLSQPWNLVGGHIVSALAGWVCGVFIPEPALAAGAAVGSAILLMQFCNCLHPPSAATALIMVVGQFHETGWHWGVIIVAANSGISLLLALAINNLLPGRRYPMHPAAAPAVNLPVAQSDIRWALEQMDSVIDVSEEDLAEIYRLAAQHAQARPAA